MTERVPPAPGATEENDARPRMQEQLVAYFAAEKWGAAILLVAGIAALAIAITVVVTKSNYRGMAWPLGLIAIFEIGIGIGLLARTDGQVAALLEQLARAPADMARAELLRMTPVMRNFAIVLIVEILVLAAGIVLTYMAGRSDFAYAIGVGCVAQASLLLVFDLFATRRAEHYVAALRMLAG